MSCMSKVILLFFHAQSVYIWISEWGQPWRHCLDLPTSNKILVCTGEICSTLTEEVQGFSGEMDRQFTITKAAIYFIYYRINKKCHVFTLEVRFQFLLFSSFVNLFLVWCVYFSWFLFYNFGNNGDMGRRGGEHDS